jgi:hypothetical protein
MSPLLLLKLEYYENKSHHLRDNSLYSTDIKSQFSHIINTGRSCNFLTYAAVIGVHMGGMSKLG